MKEFHYKWVDRKYKATQECSLIETNLAIGKHTRLLTLPRKANPSLLEKQEPIPKSTKGFFFQGALFFEGMK